MSAGICFSTTLVAVFLPEGIAISAFCVSRKISETNSDFVQSILLSDEIIFLTARFSANETEENAAKKNNDEIKNLLKISLPLFKFRLIFGENEEECGEREGGQGTRDTERGTKCRIMNPLKVFSEDFVKCFGES